MTPMVPPNPKPDPELVAYHEEQARKYLRSLPLEHFMEATAQATQRKITLESFDLIHKDRPDVQLFSELLVQYPRKGRKKLGQVVPDNMAVIYPRPIEAQGSYDLALQPAGPFLVLEYVSKNSERKDYDDNYDRYEQELRVPYYLLFYPDNQELSVFRLAGSRYVSVMPNDAGRLPIPELETEVALLDGWARFWFRGALLDLPADLLQQLREAQQQVAEAQREVTQAKRRTARAKRQAAQAQQQAAQAQQQAAAERQSRLAAEAEIARLRELLARQQMPPAP